METLKIELELTGNECFILHKLIKSIKIVDLKNTSIDGFQTVLTKIEKEFIKQQITFL